MMVRVVSKSIDRTNATTFTLPSFFFIFSLSRFFIAYHETGIERLFLSFLVNFLLQQNDSPRCFLMSLRSCHFPSLFHSFVSIHLRFLFLLIDPRFVFSLSLSLFFSVCVCERFDRICVDFAIIHCTIALFTMRNGTIGNYHGSVFHFALHASTVTVRTRHSFPQA